MARRGGGGLSIPWWLWLAGLVLAPLLLLNLAVAFFGNSAVNPLSPSFLEAKAHALGAYAKHRPGCLLFGHPSLEPLIDAAERRHRLPPGLLHALVEVESEKRVHRISAAGAMGPGQLMPGTARLLDVTDPFDPEEAIDGSARYLSEQLQRFGSLPLAIAAYNAGPGNVGSRVPRNGETEYYVEKVLRAYGRLRPPPARALVRVAAAAPLRASPPPLRPSVRPASASLPARGQRGAERPARARPATPQAPKPEKPPVKRRPAAAKKAAAGRSR